MLWIVRRWIGVRGSVAAIAALCLLGGGCSNTQSTQQALDAQLDALKMKKEPVAKFSGSVTVDGKPPVLERGQALVVMLYDPKKTNKDNPPVHAVCQKDGNFEFYTYSKGDGVPTGSYVVLFAELTSKRGSGMVQPDGLHNLYDDPDKNAQNKDFVVELTPPGKTDYAFNLDAAGKEPATPGPHAVTEIRRK